ncbi:hypothetical protein BU24DRAFT_428306 [Aaosphaeria arxii CBS 175.79]|uniref:DUF985 domain-containing protein n=1 Tax=Aaosphaeria arxii CBS 175.79 TaxID=1450172 RepID=A0A6A5X8K3_9PLEO|nr:uncharacterized protein BU24DRAFT_428306 [Aaosphaeria arxii CBS 175.79]KAF2009385.1 hypothetical protein BU24DRAFT_428306 [Aaosphaeria arxii CBS 175.79]
MSSKTEFPITTTRPLKPSESETPENLSLIKALGMQLHIEGGYFSEIDRSPLEIKSPFQQDEKRKTSDQRIVGGNIDERNLSTSIYYLLTAHSPFGCFHINKGRTIHTLVSGRGRYILLHADEDREKGKVRVETFVVGKDYEKGEKMCWVVEGGKYKASLLLPEEDGSDGEKLLITETVVPGFEYMDHDFLRREEYEGLLGGKGNEEVKRELEWLVRQ